MTEGEPMEQRLNLCSDRCAGHAGSAAAKLEWSAAPSRSPARRRSVNRLSVGSGSRLSFNRPCSTTPAPRSRKQFAVDVAKNFELWQPRTSVNRPLVSTERRLSANRLSYATSDPGASEQFSKDAPEDIALCQPHTPIMCGSPILALRKHCSAGDLSRNHSPSLCRGSRFSNAQNVGKHKGKSSRNGSVSTLHDVFGKFAMGRERMYLKDFEKLCFDAALLDSSFSVMDARRIFKNLLVGEHRSIVAEQFEPLLARVASCKMMKERDMQRMVVDCVAV